MSTFYHSINFKVEDAIEGLINKLKSTNLAGTTIFKQGAPEDIACDRIEITCDAEAEVVGATVTGNYTCDVSVAVITHPGDTTRANHVTRVAVVGDILFRDDVLAQIAAITPAISDFTPIQWFPRRVDSSTVGGEYVTTFRGEMYCKPS